jgi:hypothetical protein
MKQHDESRPGSFKSGGRHIDDHSFWAGAKPKNCVLPDGAKMKQEMSANGAGSLMMYEDTTEKIKGVQEDGHSQIKRRPLKPGTRY